jgi:hypothetical protein
MIAAGEGMTNRRTLLRLGYLARADACSADAYGLVDALHEGMYAAQVRVPPTPGDVVGVAYMISVPWAFPANLTGQSHSNTSLEGQILLARNFFILPEPPQLCLLLCWWVELQY